MELRFQYLHGAFVCYINMVFKKPFSNWPFQRIIPSLHVLISIPLSYPIYGFPDGLQLNYPWYEYKRCEGAPFLRIISAIITINSTSIWKKNSVEVIKSQKGGSKMCYHGHMYTKLATRKNQIWCKCSKKVSLGMYTVACSVYNFIYILCFWNAMMY